MEEPDFETLHYPEANILCFRYCPPGVKKEHLHRLQLEIRKKVRHDGRFFISKVDVEGVAALRVVMMNHQTNPEYFKMLVAEIRSTGRHLLQTDAGNS
jgi:L-2,4-diaminobutyrate decarboxylase